MKTYEEIAAEGEDPYLYLEEVESEESLAFARSANEKCLSQLGDPSNTATYTRVLNALESDDRIPYARLLGYEEGTGDMLLYNFWKDSKVRASSFSCRCFVVDTPNLHLSVES